MLKYLLSGIVLIVLLILLIFSFSTDETENTPELITLENVNEIEPIPPTDSFGFMLNGYTYIDDRVQRNESLYLILRGHDVSPQQIYQIQQNSGNVANLSRLMPGQRYRIYYKDDKAVSFVWRQTNTQYVTINWEDDVAVERGRLPLTKKLKQSAGVISSSLYEAILENGASTYLGSELADIFAWEIDFFALRKGDHYKVIYKELYAEGEFVGIGDIKAAEFQHRGSKYKAYHFENSDRRGYFDENGNSLQKELLKAPFRYNQRVSSGFSTNRFHPILKRNRPHYGTDYAAAPGTPILAVGDGTVIEAQRRGGNGNIVQIQHNNKYKTSYLHLRGFAPGIRAGVKVEQGQVIGYVGSTGLATGPHLCYRLYIDGKPVNSVTADLPASESLEEKYLEEFRYVVERLNDLLEEVPLMDHVAAM